MIKMKDYENEVEKCVSYLMAILKNDIDGAEKMPDPELHIAKCLKYLYDRIIHNGLVRGLYIYKIQDEFIKAVMEYFKRDRFYIMRCIEEGKDYIERKRLMQTKEGYLQVLLDLSGEYD